MAKIFVEYRTNLIELPEGDSIIGRDVACRVRFNDYSVSRRHLRVSVTGHEVRVTDLDSRNGTKLNGKPFAERATLNNNDILTLGTTWFRMVMQEDESWEQDTLGEDTFPGAADGGFPGAARCLLPAEELDEQPLKGGAHHTCPGCRSSVPIDANPCPQCGYRWGRQPLAITQEIDLKLLEQARRSPSERRRHPRILVDIPVVYESELLSFVADARDLSRSGVFVKTDLLDPVDTPCQITILPDGAPAVPIEGRVSRIISEADGSPWSGMGVEFTSPPKQGRDWLDAVLQFD